MKFSKSVIKFNIKNISVIGNFENGGLIGLTEDGRRLCEKIDTGEISEEQAMNENKELFLAMKEMNFFETGCISAGVIVCGTIGFNIKGTSI